MSLTSNQPFLGHEKVWRRFQKSFANQRMASTYLFVGPAGIGKRTVAVRLAQTLLCSHPDANFQACDTCPSCKLVAAGNHPDLVTIAKPADKNFIPLELLIGDREHRRRTGLCYDIRLTPYYGLRKVAIIDDADHLNAEGANCLLKTLEEPPDKSILILVGTSEHRQLPTILSRSQVIRFQSLDKEHLATLLSNLSVSSEIKFEELVVASQGSIHLAMKLAEQELFDFRSQWLAQLGTGDPASSGFSKSVCDFVDNRHKDAAARREEYALLADMATLFFATALRIAVDPNANCEDRKLLNAARNFLAQTEAFEAAEIAADCIERTAQFKFHIAANLSSANAVPAWLNDLGRLARREQLFIEAM